MTNTENAMIRGQFNAPSRLDDLAVQAQTFVQNAALNLLQLGRVLAEAKPLVGHGAWAQWVRENAKMSTRTAEQYMQAYSEFGLNKQIAELGTSKVLKLLPMPDEERRRLLSENDVGAMTTRQMDEAIRAQREKMREEIEAEAQKKIDAALRRAEEAAKRQSEIPDELADRLRGHEQTIEQQKGEIARLAEASRESLLVQRRLQMENNTLRRDLKEREEDMEAMQADMTRAQEELLEMQSAQARGDGEKYAADELTADVFAMAVNTFIGTCCRVPHMTANFAGMKKREKEAWVQSLKALETWTQGARQAMNALVCEEAVLVG